MFRKDFLVECGRFTKKSFSCTFGKDEMQNLPSETTRVYAESASISSPLLQSLGPRPLASHPWIVVPSMTEGFCPGISRWRQSQGPSKRQSRESIRWRCENQKSEKPRARPSQSLQKKHSPASALSLALLILLETSGLQKCEVISGYHFTLLSLYCFVVLYDHHRRLTHRQGPVKV